LHLAPVGLAKTWNPRDVLVGTSASLFETVFVTVGVPLGLTNDTTLCITNLFVSSYISYVLILNSPLSSLLYQDSLWINSSEFSFLMYSAMYFLISKSPSVFQPEIAVTERSRDDAMKL